MPSLRIPTRVKPPRITSLLSHNMIPDSVDPSLHERTRGRPRSYAGDLPCRKPSCLREPRSVDHSVEPLTAPAREGWFLPTLRKYGGVPAALDRPALASMASMPAPPVKGPGKAGLEAGMPSLWSTDFKVPA